MINPFVIKKWASMLLMAFVPTLSYILTQIYFGFSVATAVFLFMTVCFMVIANKMLANPFRQLVEGKGLLVFNMDSSGIIRPFIANLQQPYIKGNLFGKKISDIFNRKAVFNLTTPGQAEYKIDTKKKIIELSIGEEEFNTSRFGMYHYPVLIYNNQIKSLVTKDFLSNRELEVFSDHGVLYLKNKIDELSGHMRDFGRYIVESLKPGSGAFMQWLPYIILGVAILIIFMLFGPQIMASIQGAGAPIVDGVSTGTNAISAVSPR